MPYRADHAAARVHEDPVGAHQDHQAAWDAVHEHWRRTREDLAARLASGRASGELKGHEVRSLLHQHKQAEAASDVARRRAREAGAS